MLIGSSEAVRYEPITEIAGVAQGRYVCGGVADGLVGGGVDGVLEGVS